MKALSLTRPWPWAFMNGPNPKRVENRNWQPPAYIIGQTIALHAAKSWDESGRQYIADLTGLGVPPRQEHPDSEIFAVCQIVGCVKLGDTQGQLPDKQLLDWFFGPYGWLINDFYALPEPISCKGALSLWNVPPDVEREIRIRISARTGDAAGEQSMTDEIGKLYQEAEHRLLTPAETAQLPTAHKSAKAKFERPARWEDQYGQRSKYLFARHETTGERITDTCFYRRLKPLEGEDGTFRRQGFILMTTRKS